MAPAIRESLDRRIIISDADVPRATLFGAPRPVLRYADASGKGRIGAIVFPNGQRSSSRAHLLRRFLDGETGIFDRDLASVLLGAFAVASYVENWPVSVGCDNRGGGGRGYPWALLGPHWRELSSA